MRWMFTNTNGASIKFDEENYNPYPHGPILK